MSAANGCALCATVGGALIWRGEHLRVIQVDDADYPGYCRVIWNAHVREMTDLNPNDQDHLWRVVAVVEQALRDMLNPDKINLASLGNQVPHLHWHVIPRWHDDRHFPGPIWAEPRPAAARTIPEQPGDVWTVRRQAAAGLARPLGQILDSVFPW